MHRAFSVWHGGEVSLHWPRSKRATEVTYRTFLRLALLF